MKVVAGIPALNEEHSIAKAIVWAVGHADEVVVVYDGSANDTALIAKGLGAEHADRMC